MILYFKYFWWQYLTSSFTNFTIFTHQQGNLYQFRELTGWYGSKVLYFGDHVYSDLAVSNIFHKSLLLILYVLRVILSLKHQSLSREELGKCGVKKESPKSLFYVPGCCPKTRLENRCNNSRDRGMRWILVENIACKSWIWQWYKWPMMCKWYLGHESFRMKYELLTATCTRNLSRG